VQNPTGRLANHRRPWLPGLSKVFFYFDLLYGWAARIGHFVLMMHLIEQFDEQLETVVRVALRPRGASQGRRSDRGGGGGGE